MASRTGAYIQGTDGSDFQHRQRVASHYQASAAYKSRLKMSIFCHGLLAVVLLAKVSEDILDRLDIFILSLQELYVPKPLLWEWCWLMSIPVAGVGLSALRKNNAASMKIYVSGTFMFGIVPVLAAAFLYFSEMSEYIQTKSNVTFWQGYPIAVLWYIFIVLAVQIHVFSLYFAIRLILAWQKVVTVRKAK
ncbi:protein jagunal-like isoform X2 [Varroa jacobsoni]|uniref:Protein jagunal n=1 Tax=Varroa destructor TaxID=109461 RepID=A0A7M7M5N2_VARDE|nr:protein jagunal-like isoform X2 [Varroa destructor]XP_022700447.1 protein jagunal-like isoform X2 [Varroa jacobsoni]